MPATMCQYGNCLEEVGHKDGIVVSLKTPTYDGEKRAIYCCALHASLALLRLSIDRRESEGQNAQQQVDAIPPDLVPRHWRVT